MMIPAMIIQIKMKIQFQVNGPEKPGLNISTANQQPPMVIQIKMKISTVFQII